MASAKTLRQDWAWCVQETEETSMAGAKGVIRKGGGDEVREGGGHLW